MRTLATFAAAFAVAWVIIGAIQGDQPIAVGDRHPQLVSHR